MMQDLVLSASEPLYGRADAIINLQPIPVPWMMDALGINATAAVVEHSVWGGVPRYWELREQYPSLEEAVEGTMLQTNGVRFRVAQKLLYKASLLPEARDKKVIPVLFLRESPKDGFSPDILLPADVIPLTWG